jgi:hypothetical protein
MLVNTSETSPVFLCQPFRRRQDIYVVGKVFFNDEINNNFKLTCNLLKFKGNILINLVIFLQQPMHG